VEGIKERVRDKCCSDLSLGSLFPSEKLIPHVGGFIPPRAAALFVKVLY
jgi:hypothetical protein